MLRNYGMASELALCSPRNRSTANPGRLGVLPPFANGTTRILPYFCPYFLPITIPMTSPEHFPLRSGDSWKVVRRWKKLRVNLGSSAGATRPRHPGGPSLPSKHRGGLHSQLPLHCPSITPSHGSSNRGKLTPVMKRTSNPRTDSPHDSGARPSWALDVPMRHFTQSSHPSLVSPESVQRLECLPEEIRVPRQWRWRHDPPSF